MRQPLDLYPLLLPVRSDKPRRTFAAGTTALLLAALLGGASACSDKDNPQLDSGLTPDAGIDSAIFDSALPDTAPPGLPLALNLVHLNDSHSMLAPVSMNLGFGDENDEIKTYGAEVGGIARAVTKVKAVREQQEPSLVLHAGDALQGSLYFTEYEGMADAALLNLLGLDAMALGNHEFDRGSETLAAFIEAVNFPLLGANVDVSDDAALKDRIAPYVIKELSVDGRLEKVAIIGLTTPDTPIISSPAEEVRFGDPVATLTATVAALESEGINKIIVLSHLGLDDDRALAAVDGVDVIVGGHTHTLMGDFGDLGLTAAEPYPLEVARGEQLVCIVQAGAKLQLVGVLQVQFDKDGQVTSCQGSPVLPVGDNFVQFNPTTRSVEPVDEATKARILEQIELNPAIEVIEPDETAQETLAPFTEGIEALMRQEIAGVSEDLLHVRVPGTHHISGDPMVKGSYIAPLVAEGMIWKVGLLNHRAHAALINGGGVRTDILAGPLSVGEVYTLLPFQNTLTLIELTGAELKEVLEQGVENATAAGSKGGSFPYVAGIRYTADMSQPTGSRITSVELPGVADSWAAIDPQADYTLVTLDFLARGGDGYTTLAALSQKTPTGFLDAEAFMEYASDKQTLQRPAADSGVTFLPLEP